MGTLLLAFAPSRRLGLTLALPSALRGKMRVFEVSRSLCKSTLFFTDLGAELRDIGITPLRIVVHEDEPRRQEQHEPGAARDQRGAQLPSPLVLLDREQTPLVLLMPRQLFEANGSLRIEASSLDLGLPETVHAGGLVAPASFLLSLPRQASFLRGSAPRGFSCPLGVLGGASPRPFSGPRGRFVCDALFFDGHQFLQGTQNRAVLAVRHHELRGLLW